LRSKDNPLSWPLAADQPDPVTSPQSEVQVDNALDKANLNLNPNVPEFVPSFASTTTPTISAASNAVDPVRDDDEAGTDGDDESEIVNHKVRAKNEKGWVEVKNKKADRKSLPKDSTPGRSDKEELDFQFDEDLDMPVVGRQNKFSPM
jgi:hypothetical protein